MNQYFKYFIEGMASISLVPGPPIVTSFTDAEALESDWNAVGRDLEWAIKKTETE